MNASSSSLAMALSEPIQKKKKPPPKVHKAEDSAGFFNNFISQQTAELKAAAKTSSVNGVDKMPHKRSREHSEGSPDPMNLTPATPNSSRKRKAAQALESPSTKRAIAPQNGNGISTPPTTSEARTSPSIHLTPTPRPKLEPYLVMPPVPKAYQTPSQRIKGKMRADSEEDLGGYGDGGESPTKWRSNGVTSSARKATGDRDDRGEHIRDRR